MGRSALSPHPPRLSLWPGGRRVPPASWVVCCLTDTPWHHPETVAPGEKAHFITYMTKHKHEKEKNNYRLVKSRQRNECLWGTSVCTCSRWCRLRSSMMGVMELALTMEEYSSSVDCLALVIWSCTAPGKPWALDTTLEHADLSWSLRPRTMDRARHSSCCECNVNTRAHGHDLGDCISIQVMLGWLLKPYFPF